MTCKTITTMFNARFALIAFVVSSTIFLQGCIAAVAGGAVVATKAATDPRSVGTQVNDGTLELRVESAINQDEQMRAETRVSATAFKGVVVLAGQAPSPELQNRAKQIAEGVEGVTRVHNGIRIGTPIGLDVAANDTWITTKVRSQLLTSSDVKSSNIKINTENGEVFLLGLVTQKGANSAAEIARNTAGVRKVILAFDYLD
ncbi:division/outer membrane stress-associated lipid-binding lipoprotein [Thorsellia anophelis]|uniref:Osmotically-inducible protein OsmY, contains BON domain n=1 Tax=Thorsellia anophelis DSM 18579 TaxID=1123402 RepID=A0A1I0C7N4_9GAMM|nr:division/outer membrane stress-associated lipid-binding lipoprotein [Thorsellia anophelis]SET15471.1 Osmotically-inducible protein OsmY, contains BON domain [Thorsellia anophelis DSM 18579]